MNQKTQLNEQVDLFVAYKFIKILTTDFEKTDAFKLGIIDKNGKILKKRKDLRGEERAAYTIFHTLIWNLKKVLARVPGLKSKLGSYATALFLLKEAYNKEYKQGGEVLVERILEHLRVKDDELDVLFESKFQDKHLSAGVYIANQEIVTPSFDVIEEGDVIVVGNDKLPLDEMKDVHIYSAVHMNSGEEILINKSSVEKINEDITTAPEEVAGMAVFDVDHVPHEMVHGRKNYERWGKDRFNSLDDIMKSTIRKYSYKNKGKDIALRAKDGTITKLWGRKR
tara:strand:- start:249 stop:1094 length:846 start_codon:yes stop_codon:yes gene_type:complete